MSNIYLLLLLNWVETVFFCDIRIYLAAVLSSRWCNQHHSFCIVIILLFIIIILITLFRRTHLVAWPLNRAQNNYKMTIKVECLLRFKAPTPVKIAWEFQINWISQQSILDNSFFYAQLCLAAVYLIELQTKIYTKARYHREGHLLVLSYLRHY